MEHVLQVFLDELEKDRARIEACFERLSDQAVWRRPRTSMNSIANLCLHLAGNETHYIGEVIGGRPSGRRRSEEFLATGGATCQELVARLATARGVTREVLEELTLEDLERPVESDHPKEATVLRVVLHVTEHYGYHTGQIVLLTRLAQDGDERLLEWGH